MSIFSDILSAITTRGRRITIKMGLAKDFNDSKLKVGELGLIIDEDEVRIGLANGTTKKLGGLDVSELPNASTTTKGIVQLSSSTSSTSTTLAATASAVKTAYDLANTANGKTYTLPDATSTTLGGVKVGTNINVTSGTISVVDASTSAKGVVQLNDTLTSTSTTLALTAKQGNEIKKLIDNLTASSGGGITIADIPIASATQDGLMPKAMVTKLSGIATGANFVQVTDSVTSTSTTQAASANSVKQAYDLANTAKTLAEGSGTSSVNIYQSNISKHSQSNAIGHFTTASGTQSTAMGANTTASGSQSTAMGMYATASGTLSTATGYYTVASGKGASANGNITTASDASSFAIGSCNKAMSGSSSSFSTSNTALLIGNSASESSKSNAFRVMFNGASYGQSAFNSTGADYAEYFEWLDSNTDNEDRVGYFVALNGEKIEIANSNSDYIIGVISANPSIIGDSYQDQWQGMYVTDEWGRIQNEYIDVEYEEINEEGNTITKTRQDYVHKLNPNYDTNSEYTPREQRKEWSAVGMLGKLLVRDDGTCEVNGYAKVSDGGIATKSDSGYRVIKRVDENIVQIIFK